VFKFIRFYKIADNSIRTEGKRLLENHAIAPSAARLCSCPFGEPVNIRDPKTAPLHRNDTVNEGCAFGWLAHSRNSRLRLFTEDTRISLCGASIIAAGAFWQVQDQYELPFHTVSLCKDAFLACFGETG
jgi:hypothetical protein